MHGFQIAAVAQDVRLGKQEAERLGLAGPLVVPAKVAVWPRIDFKSGDRLLASLEEMRMTAFVAQDKQGDRRLYYTLGCFVTSRGTTAFNAAKNKYHPSVVNIDVLGSDGSGNMALLEQWAATEITWVCSSSHTRQRLGRRDVVDPDIFDDIAGFSPWVDFGGIWNCGRLIQLDTVSLADHQERR